MPRLQCVEYARGAGSAGRAAGGNPREGEQAAAGNGRKRHAPSEIPEETSARATTGIGELDRVLGGGVVEGSLMLVGGDPGIGKSTLLLQASEHLARGGARVLYYLRRESVRQIKMRAAAGRDERQSAHPQRKRDGCGRAPLGGNRAGLHDYRLDPDDVPPGHGQRARQRFCRCANVPAC